MSEAECLSLCKNMHDINWLFIAFSEFSPKQTVTGGWDNAYVQRLNLKYNDFIEKPIVHNAHV